MCVVSRKELDGIWRWNKLMMSLVVPETSGDENEK
jgi:hypothetical protein